MLSDQDVWLVFTLCNEMREIVKAHAPLDSSRNNNNTFHLPYNTT